jgi:hydrogenase expression/formation protein HypE
MEMLMSTDSFTVQPLFFPGGNIGHLAVHGTVNDLAVSGAEPSHLTLNLVLEEGLAASELEIVMAGFAEAANAAGVKVCAGDTKVVPKGQGSGIYMVTTGIGWKSPELELSMHCIQAGDKIVVSGSVGDHGIAVMMAREQFGLSGDVKSDAACVLPFTRVGRDISGVRFMRDPTRGGVATVLHELQITTELGIEIDESAVPVKPAVRSVCDLLGYDPYYLACEGRVVAVVAAEHAEALVAQWRALPDGQEAAIIGEFVAAQDGVWLNTPLGGQRYLEQLEDEPLPRIC